MKHKTSHKISDKISLVIDQDNNTKVICKLNSDLIEKTESLNSTDKMLIPFVVSSVLKWIENDLDNQISFDGLPNPIDTLN
jgi:RNA recognition motif-containing protein